MTATEVVSWIYPSRSHKNNQTVPHRARPSLLHWRRARWSPTARGQRMLVHLVYLVYLVGRTGNSSRRTRQTRKTSQPDRRTRARCTCTETV